MRRLCLLTLLAKVLGKRVEFRSIGVYPYKWGGSSVIRDKPKPFNDKNNVEDYLHLSR